MNDFSGQYLMLSTALDNTNSIIEKAASRLDRLNSNALSLEHIKEIMDIYDIPTLQKQRIALVARILALTEP